MSAGHDGIVLATANGSMFVVHHIPTGLTAFASERSILEKIVDIGLRPFLPIAKDAVVQLLPGELTALPLNKPTPVATRWSEAPCHVLATRLSPRTVSDHVTANIRSATIATSVNVSRHAEIETLTIIDWDAIRSLRRCTKCVLPETFPFIRFDGSGVCNFCNNHRPHALKGETKLRQELESVRRGDGKPEILFPISGGRDSCYALHVVVRDFGIKPVAYTYDWGMVTDLARRNISRMCGALGI